MIRLWNYKKRKLEQEKFIVKVFFLNPLLFASGEFFSLDFSVWSFITFKAFLSHLSLIRQHGPVGLWSLWIHSNLEHALIVWSHFFHAPCRECCSCQEPRGEGMQLRRDLNFSKPAAGFSCHGEDSHGEHFSTQARPLPADSCPDRFVPCSVASFQPEIPHFPQRFLTFGWVAKPTCSTPGSLQPNPAVCSFPSQFQSQFHKLGCLNSSNLHFFL